MNKNITETILKMQIYQDIINYYLSKNESIPITMIKILDEKIKKETKQKCKKADVLEDGINVLFKCPCGGTEDMSEFFSSKSYYDHGGSKGGYCQGEDKYGDCDVELCSKCKYCPNCLDGIKYSFEDGRE